jgi:phenylpyruvate tautomerase PptA (4-oxalocrotonate tautomerase family)
MPLVTIDLLQGRSDQELDAISGAVHEAMVELLEVPERDRFQIITEHEPRTFRFDPG